MDTDETLTDLKEPRLMDWWNEMSDAERDSIDIGLADADSGGLRPHSAARSIYEKWL